MEERHRSSRTKENKKINVKNIGKNVLFIHNLEILPIKDNASKNIKCSISKDKLIELYETKKIW